MLFSIADCRLFDCQVQVPIADYLIGAERLFQPAIGNRQSAIDSVLSFDSTRRDRLSNAVFLTRAVGGNLLID